MDQDGYISREEMEKAMESTYKMVGGLVEFPEGETSPQMRVNHLFEVMDTVSRVGVVSGRVGVVSGHAG